MLPISFVPDLSDQEVADLLKGFAILNGAAESPEVAKIRLVQRYLGARAVRYTHQAALYECGLGLQAQYPAAPAVWLDHSQE